MRQKLDPGLRDIDECWQQMQLLLEEYNAALSYDKEIKQICLSDNDDYSAIWFKDKNVKVD